MLIDKKFYHVQPSEFKKVESEFQNLQILEHVGVFERLISLIQEISNLFNLNKILFVNPTHGGFIFLNLNMNIFVKDVQLEHLKNIELNCNLHITFYIAVEAKESYGFPN